MAPRVVVVDDDRHIRVAARVLLEAEGFDVLTLGSPDAALLALRRNGATAAIIDFDFEHRAGLDLASAIAEDGALEDLAVIGVASDLGALPKELVDLAIQKPYATCDLARLVRAAIEGARHA